MKVALIQTAAVALAGGALAWALVEVGGPFLARHEVVLTVRPLPMIPHQQQREFGI